MIKDLTTPVTPISHLHHLPDLARIRHLHTIAVNLHPSLNCQIKPMPRTGLHLL